MSADRCTPVGVHEYLDEGTHLVIILYVCSDLSGNLIARSDASQVGWLKPTDLGPDECTEGLLSGSRAALHSFYRGSVMATSIDENKTDALYPGKGYRI